MENNHVLKAEEHCRKWRAGMDGPRVSVVMPVYNGERYVAEAVESILSQSFQDFEFLVFDDGSEDRTFAIINEYATRDHRIHLVRKRHQGYVPWLNEGLAASRGEFIARMDADDISLPERFARQVEYLREHVSCSAVGCGLLLIDPDGSPLCYRIFEGDHDKLDAKQIMGEFPAIAHPASMIRRSSLIKAGGYREEYESMEEFDLWLRLAEHGRLANLPNVLFKYRQHHQSVNATQVMRQKSWADHIVNEARTRRGLKPLSRSISNDYAPPTTAVERHLDWAMNAAASGFRIVAFKHALLALKADPVFIKVWAVFVRCFVPNEIISFLKRFGCSRIWATWYLRHVRE